MFQDSKLNHLWRLVEQPFLCTEDMRHQRQFGLSRLLRRDITLHLPDLITLQEFGRQIAALQSVF
jgi:hypothetical protein